MSGPASPTKRRKAKILNCRRKVPHETHEQAEMAMIAVAMAGRLYSPDTTVYQCEVCGSFHWASHTIRGVNPHPSEKTDNQDAPL